MKTVIAGALAVILFISSSAPCQGQVFSFGTCPQYTALTLQLPSNLFSGTSYEYARAHHGRHHGWICTRYNFANVYAPRIFAMVIRGVNKLTGAPLGNTGTVLFVGNVAGGPIFTLTGGLRMTFHNNKFGVPNDLTYYIIARDMVNPDLYVTLFACKQLAFGKIIDVIILTSTRNPATTSTQPAFAAALGVGVPEHLLKTTKQTGCPDNDLL